MIYIISFFLHKFLEHGYLLKMLSFRLVYSGGVKTLILKG